MKTTKLAELLDKEIKRVNSEFGCRLSDLSELPPYKGNLGKIDVLNERLSYLRGMIVAYGYVKHLISDLEGAV